MSSFADYAMNDYRQRHGPVGFPVDAWHQYQVESLRNWLIKLEMVMEDNGVAQHVQKAIITALVYGQPDPSESIMRQATRKQIRDLIEKGPPSVLVQTHDLDEILNAFGK